MATPGARLKAWLNAQGVSQEGFGERIGVVQEHVSKLCSDKATPSVETAQAIERETKSIIKWTEWFPKPRQARTGS